MKNLLQVQDVYQQIRGRVILDKISFDVESEEIVGLFGPNGAGKSTLLRKIANTEQMIGNVVINGIPNDFTKFRTDVILVTGDIEIPRLMTLRNYCKLLSTSFEIDNKFVEEYCQKLEIDIDARVGSLSKGNKEMAQLIACLATNCKLVLLDEPFSAIDIYKRDVILEMIIDSKLSGKTIIITTHLIDEISPILDKVAYIHDTKLEFYLDSEEIQEQSDSVASYLKERFKGE